MIVFLLYWMKDELYCVIVLIQDLCLFIIFLIDFAFPSHYLIVWPPTK